MKKVLLLAAGWILVSLGALGVFVPVLPTTPFLLAAAVCFSATSPKSVAFLEKSPLFGPYIQDWRTKRGVYLRDKVRALALLWAGLLFSMALLRNGWLILLLTVVGAAVTVHILRIRTRKD